MYNSQCGNWKTVNRPSKRSSNLFDDTSSCLSISFSVFSCCFCCSVVLLLCGANKPASSKRAPPIFCAGNVRLDLSLDLFDTLHAALVAKQRTQRTDPFYCFIWLPNETNDRLFSEGRSCSKHDRQIFRRTTTQRRGGRKM